MFIGERERANLMCSTGEICLDTRTSTPNAHASRVIRKLEYRCTLFLIKTIVLYSQAYSTIFFCSRASSILPSLFTARRGRSQGPTKSRKAKVTSYDRDICLTSTKKYVYHECLEMRMRHVIRKPEYMDLSVGRSISVYLYIIST